MGTTTLLAGRDCCNISNEKRIVNDKKVSKTVEYSLKMSLEELKLHYYNENKKREKLLIEIPRLTKYEIPKHFFAVQFAQFLSFHLFN